MKGRGMREDDLTLTKTFAQLVQHKLEIKECSGWLSTAKQVSKCLENLVLLSCIFNVIAWSVEPHSGMNNLWFAKVVKVGKSRVKW